MSVDTRPTHSARQQIEVAPPALQAAGGLLRIDRTAIAGNFRALADTVGAGRCGSVVKADAYGLGIDAVVPALVGAGCTTFFVAQLNEGLALRRILPLPARIFVLNGLAPGAETACAAANLIPVANHPGQVAAWAALSRRSGKRLPMALQLDSGMSRLGLSHAEVQGLAAEPGLLAAVDLQLVMSHLACADEPDHEASEAQRTAFNSARALLPPAPASLANSAGIFLGNEFHLDLCRPGAALYGIRTGPASPPMRPTVKLSGRVAQVRQIDRGSFVGYGYAFRAPGPMRLATIAVGYADGWPRHLGAGSAVWWGEARLPLVGRVSMDSFVVDLAEASDAPPQPGDFVELIGEHQSVDDVADAAGTIGYEILTRLGHRFHRVIA
jgi:alanine racemase